jgi:hypothetical protein
MADDNNDFNESLSSQSQESEPPHAAESQDIKDDSKENLPSIGSVNSVALSKSFPKIPTPNIRLENGDRIALPLSYMDAQAIIAASREALLENDEGEVMIGMLFPQLSLTNCAVLSA